MVKGNSKVVINVKEPVIIIEQWFRLNNRALSFFLDL